MKKSSIVLDKPGVYFFAAPAEIKTQIDRELFVVAWMPEQKACGFVLYDPETPLKDLFASLDTVFEKAATTSDRGAPRVVFKVFGLSRRQAKVMTGLSNWLSQIKLKISAQDVGKNVGRNIKVDCKTGRIGISYAEAYLPGFPQLMSRGSARQRLRPSSVKSDVLILSRSAVSRQLALQTIEEQRNWSGSTPHKPEEIIGEQEVQYFPWSWVILFEDLADEPNLMQWVTTIRKAHPKVQFCWIGLRLPKDLETMPGIAMLPPLEPQHVGEFKAYLAALLALGRPEDNHWGHVLTFPPSKKLKQG